MLNTGIDDFFIFVTVMYCIDIIVRFCGLGWSSYSANGWNIFDIVVAAGSLFTTLIVRFNAGGFVVQQLQKLFLTCIALKLVQRVNSLNKLFKTAVYVSVTHPQRLSLTRVSCAVAACRSF